MKKFTKGKKIYFLENYNFETLSVGWIYGKGKYENNIQYWKIVLDENELNVNEKLLKKIYEFKEFFILKETDKKVTTYNKISKYLKQNFIKHNVYDIDQKAKLFLKSNNRIRIFFSAIINLIKKVLSYFFQVVILGLVKLIIGDLFGYFKNEHDIYSLNKKLTYAKMKNQIMKNMSVDGEVKESGEAERIQEKISNKKKDNIEINRVIIATVFAIISLIISIWNK